MNRAVLYFFYDGEGIVDDYNLYMLQDLKKSASKIYVVVNGLLTDEGRKRFETVADDVFVRENVGLDVWAYKEGMQHIGWDVVLSYDEFIMMNHTNFGPVYSTVEMFAEMDQRTVDFWGITKHNGHEIDPYNACEYGYIPAHIQSSFIAVRQSMLKSADFKKYWDEMPMIQGYVDSICRHEAVFTEKFTRLGYKSDVYVNTDDLKDVCDYPLMMMPVELIKNRRCPVFKRKSFFNVYEELMDVSCGQATTELYDYLRRTSDKVFLNVDNPHLCSMASERHLQSDPERPYSLVLPYGMEYSGAKVLPSSPEQPYLRIAFPCAGQDFTLSTHLIGSYNADNVVAAIAIGAHFGVAFEDACAAIAAYVPSNNRSQMTATEHNTLIVDAYNANPTSMDAALTNFSNIEAASKIALLGDMLELGEDSLSEHVTVIEKALRCTLDKVCLVGAEFGKALESVPEAAHFIWFADSQALAGWLAEQKIEGATVLIKGSRGTRMEKTIQSL